MKRSEVREKAQARADDLARRHYEDKVSMASLGRELGLSCARISQIIGKTRPKVKPEQPA